MTKDKVLITGAAGFIGHAVRRVLESRGTPTVAIDRLPRTEEGYPNIVCDLTDIHRLHAIAAEYPIGAIIHCGAHSGPMVARDNPHSMVDVNIGGTANLLEVARIHKISRFVYSSSASVYGNTPRGPVPEDVALSPTSVYAGSKAAGEQLVASYARQFGVDGVSLRLSWVYGPRRATDCVIRTMIENAINGVKTRMTFGKDFHRQFIHVNDAAAALVAALDRQFLPRQTYTVTGGTYATLGEVGEIVRRVLPHADIDLQPGNDREDDIQERFDISAAIRDLDYRPIVSLEEGVKTYADWLVTRSKPAIAA